MKKIIKGILVGSAYMIPGLCSASLAITLSCYEDLLTLFTSFYKRKVIKEQWLFIVGMIGGIILSYLFLSKLYDKITLFLLVCFMGFVIGGMELPKFDKEKIKINLIKILLIIIGFGSVILINIIGNNRLYINNTNTGVLYYLITTILAGLSSFALILPGISGALLLLVFGLYEKILKAVEWLITNIFQFERLLNEKLFFLLCFILGFLSGLWLFSKILTFFIRKKVEFFKCLSFGFIIGSLFIIGSWIIKYPLNIKNVSFSIIFFIISMVLMKYIKKEKVI